jgi:hypothetical protein
MNGINTRHCLRASSSAAERAYPAGRLSTLIRAAMICGALVTAGWDAARAQPDAGQKELDKYKQPGGLQILREKTPRELEGRDAAFARIQRARAEEADNDGTARIKPRRDRAAQRDEQSGRHAQRDRNAGEARHAQGGAPLRRAYKHYRTEGRQLGRAAAGFVHHPRYGTYRRLGHGYRQARTARGQFHHAAVRYARNSHYAGARPLRRAYGHYRVERRQFHRAAAGFARRR